jgi:phosphoribosylanthranilate isomerase
MSLKTKVKVGNITNLSDARYCAGMGVDWLGFPSNGVDPILLKEITGWVSGPRYYLEATELNQPGQLKEFSLTVAEIGVHQLSWMKQVADMKWMVRLNPSGWTRHHRQLQEQASAIIALTIEAGDNRHDPVLAEMRKHFHVFLDISSSPLIAGELLTLPADGVHLSGSRELKPGLKSYEQLATVLEALEMED